MRIIEKTHRLMTDCYVGKKIVSVTICSYRRKVNLLEKILFEKLKKELFNSAEKNNCTIILFLFMPDHLHIIIEGNSEFSNIKGCLKLFKQKTGFWYKQNYNCKLWQKDFYDRIIRSEVELDKQINYILNNPIKTNFVKHFLDYNYWGSDLIDFDKKTQPKGCAYKT